MIGIYIVAAYIIGWFFTFCGVKLEGSCDYQESLIDSLREGHYWWILIPFVNVLAGIYFFCWGLTLFIKDKDLVDFIFGAKK